jgi:hypothetical protein
MDKLALSLFLSCSVLLATFASSAVWADSSEASTGKAPLEVRRGIPLDTKIRKFLGHAENPYSRYQGTVAEQVIAHIAIADRPFAIPLEDGRWLLSGILPHGSPEAAAILMDGNQRILGVGLIEYVGMVGDNRQFELWIYTHKDAFSNEYVSDIKSWSRSKGLSVKVMQF